MKLIHNLDIGISNRTFFKIIIISVFIYRESGRNAALKKN